MSEAPARNPQLNAGGQPIPSSTTPHGNTVQRVKSQLVDECCRPGYSTVSKRSAVAEGFAHQHVHIVPALAPLVGQRHSRGCTLPPPLCPLPGAQPDWGSFTDGGTVLSWTRDIGDSVWVSCEDTVVDGERVRSPAAIGYTEPPRDRVNN